MLLIQQMLLTYLPAMQLLFGMALILIVEIGKLLLGRTRFALLSVGAEPGT